MHRLVLDHSYRTGLAWDRSPFRNHGVPTNVLKTGSGLNFNGLNSDVRVAPADSLQKLRSIWVGCTFGLQSMGGGGARRFNLVEGHLAFALFVTPQLQLKGTFLNPDGNWTGMESPPATILPNQGYSVAFYYDGIANAALEVNGSVVAERHDLFGPVRDVGPLGVHVGRWPDANQYVFSGTIDRVKLFKEEPNDDGRKLGHPCCFDEKRLRELMVYLLKKGHRREELDDWYDRLREFAAHSERQVTEGDPVRSQLYKRQQKAIWDAFCRGDGNTLAYRAQQLNRLVSKDVLQKLTAQGQEILEDVPLSLAEIFSFVDGICGLDLLLNSLLVDKDGNAISIDRLLAEAKRAGIKTGSESDSTNGGTHNSDDRQRDY